MLSLRQGCSAPRGRRTIAPRSSKRETLILGLGASTIALGLFDAPQARAALVQFPTASLKNDYVLVRLHA
jgi:hypothetical protein